MVLPEIQEEDEGGNMNLRQSRLSLTSLLLGESVIKDTSAHTVTQNTLLAQLLPTWSDAADEPNQADAIFMYSE